MVLVHRAQQAFRSARSRTQHLVREAKENPKTLAAAMNVWPVFRAAGVRVRHIAPDWSSARVELHQGKLNMNYVGTHFGGTLFAMSDPFWMILMLRRLGPDYIVWDKAGEIDFKSPGRGTVTTEIRLDDAAVEAMRAEADAGGKSLMWFENDIVDASGTVVATVRKQLYARPKNR
ncbi:DUF4442 domain-containing protein [Brevibacterium luteolum]|uniref:DUF4442 domain-containing protein n=1 Tax=Brevibacterium luteolum TaxID=199591 RepID=UPI00223BAD8F|nr:DUF4442 domain-containing protein [Brevibacterium luteolum]MCT1657066.1 DUF4442 domain-containing protein [Brevibacterium luteolum]MCT1920984.1 DUF4442 domain-containing protein [Brevibacterium luteolum]